MRRTAATVVLLLVLVSVAGARGRGEAEPEPIRVGVLTVGVGFSAIQGQDALRGFAMAIGEYENEVAGRRITTRRYYSDGTPASALAAARRAIDEDQVDILVGPLAANEGVAIAEFAKLRPAATFINGSSAAPEATLFVRAPNFFRFTLDGMQWQGGLGTYAYRNREYRRIAVVAEDYAFQHTQRRGFLLEFEALGGRVVDNFWVPIDRQEFSSVIAALPDDDEIDAVWLGLRGSSAVVFLEQYVQAGRTTPLTGSSVTVDASLLDVRSPFREFLIGTLSSGPVAVDIDTPEWTAFIESYREEFSEGFAAPSMFCHAYYVGTQAMLRALQEVEGDLSDGHSGFRKALENLDFVQPVGRVRLDHNRQAIGSNVITMVVEDTDGNLINSAITIAGDINQTMGVPEGEFLERLRAALRQSADR
jgi:branched-chain amino acid transport system substrate-binding protein